MKSRLSVAPGFIPGWGHNCKPAGDKPPRYKDIEFLKPAEIKDTQRELFIKHFNYLASNSPYYRSLLKDINTDKVKLENISALPFTDKALFEEHNQEFLAVPMSKVSDIVLSSGTTGKPTKIMYTERDLQRLAYNEEVSFSRCGITPEDVVLLTCTMDRCFVAGLAYFLGIRNIGAAAVRNGLNSFASHMEIIQQMNPTVMVGVPSFLYKLGLFLKSSGLDPKETSVRKMVCIGEPIRDKDLALSKLGERLEEIWSARIFSTYASSEVVTTFCECSAQAGGHFNPALAVVEIVDNQGKVLPPGETGEVVITPLFIEGMPLLRFKTGDISYLLDESCTCGRFSPRLGPILGRKKQMIKFCGTTLYPQAIYSVLDDIPQVSEYYVTVSSDFDLSDKVMVYVSVKDNSCPTDEIIDKLQSRLRIRPAVTILTEDEVKKQIYSEKSRKLVRFYDLRS